MVLLKNNSGKDVVYPVHLNENPNTPPMYLTILNGETKDLPIEWSKVAGFEPLEPLPEEPVAPLPLELRKRKSRGNVNAIQE